jgi:hypothetical protein
VRRRVLLIVLAALSLLPYFLWRVE